MQTQAVYDETPDQLELVAIGEQAIETLKKTFEAHLAIARGFATGIEHAQRVARTDDPSDRFYQKAFGGWLDRHPKYRAFNKPYRHWAVRCLDHEAEILKWRAEQGDKELAKFHYPEIVFKRWAKANRPELLTDKQRGEPKPPTVSKKDQDITDLQEENDTLSREMEELRAEKERLEEQLRELEGQHRQEPIESNSNGRLIDLDRGEPSAIAMAWWESPDRDRIAAACKAFLVMAKGSKKEKPEKPLSSGRREFHLEKLVAAGDFCVYPHSRADTSNNCRRYTERHGVEFLLENVEGGTKVTRVTPTDDRPTRPPMRRRDRSEDGAPDAEGGAPGTSLQNPAEVSTEQTSEDATLSAQPLGCPD